jgi:hypothetical protein
MSVIFAESSPADDQPADPGKVIMTAEELNKAREYTSRLQSVGGSLLSNASNLKKLLDKIEQAS